MKGKTGKSLVFSLCGVQAVCLFKMFVEIQLFGKECTGIFDKTGVGNAVYQYAAGFVFGFCSVVTEGEEAAVDLINGKEVRDV